ncbi:uncharacterized protein LOC141936449 isoform X2 [Strix uralensis]|uniref:uncharacterized protein LOC141936449 isoform X2 n=1 Tax=Strix uralensis TaxID=36305 RepID=UPI003DA72755
MDSCGNTGEPVTHDYLEMIEAVYSSQPDLKEEPSEVADESWYTDGSSFVRQGICKAGYAVTTEDQIHLWNQNGKVRVRCQLPIQQSRLWNRHRGNTTPG